MLSVAEKYFHAFLCWRGDYSWTLVKWKPQRGKGSRLAAFCRMHVRWLRGTICTCLTRSGSSGSTEFSEFWFTYIKDEAFRAFRLGRRSVRILDFTQMWRHRQPVLVLEWFKQSNHWEFEFSWLQGMGNGIEEVFCYTVLYRRTKPTEGGVPKKQVAISNRGNGKSTEDKL